MKETALTPKERKKKHLEKIKGTHSRLDIHIPKQAAEKITNRAKGSGLTKAEYLVQLLPMENRNIKLQTQLNKLTKENLDSKTKILGILEDITALSDYINKLPTQFNFPSPISKQLNEIKEKYSEPNLLFPQSVINRDYNYFSDTDEWTGLPK